MFSLANKLSLASLTFKPTPPVPERKVISSATSLDITRQDSPTDGGLETLTMPPPRHALLLVCYSALDQRSHSAGPVIIEATEGAEPPATSSGPSPNPRPDARSTSPR